MKISDKKRASNKANSQLSTGPKTPAGKAKVSQNAQKHGFTSNKIVVNEDEREHFQSLHDNLLVDACPASTTEHLVFSQLLYAAWNQERIRMQEGALLLRGLDALADPDTAKQLDLLNRYSNRFERSFLRCISELRKLQTNRAINQNWTARTGEQASLFTEVGKIAKQSHRFDNEEHYRRVLPKNQPDYSTKEGIKLAEAGYFQQEVAQINSQGGHEADPNQEEVLIEIPADDKEAQAYFEKLINRSK